jgi:hypothetical protein
MAESKGNDQAGQVSVQVYRPGDQAPVITTSVDMPLVSAVEV